MEYETQYQGQWQPPQQQQGGMQPYYNPYYAPRPQPQPEPQGARKHTLLVIMSILLIVVLVSLVFVYVNVGKEQTATKEEPTYAYATGEIPPEELTEPEFKMTNFKFASVVDDNLNYQEVPATFNIGDEFWIYFEVNNLQSGELRGKYRTSYDENIVVTGPNGKAIDEMTGFLGTTTENGEEGKYYSFPIAHQLVTTTSYAPGKYDITIFIDDTINQKNASISAAFILK